MKNRIFCTLAAGLLLTLGACNSNDKPVETTAQDNSPSGDTAVVMRNNADPEAMYRQRARRVAERVYTDLKMSDTTVRSKFQMAYYNRVKRYGELRSKYQADTTGQYQAMRQAEMETDKEMQTVLTDPKMYKEYETHRSDYYKDLDAPDQMDADGTSSSMGDSMNTQGTMNADGSMSSGAGSGSNSMSPASSSETSSGKMEGDKAKVKIKGDDGSKVKMKNGDVKYKDADGKKTKVNGD